MSTAEADNPSLPTPGGYRELIWLALPLILSASFWTVQITIDRVLLSRLGPDVVGAAMPGVMLFWTPLALLQNTALYVTVFVAQYVGAGRPRQVGPVVWQAIYFAGFSGVAFLGLLPASEWIVSLTGHAPELQRLEAEYFRALCWCALPTLLVNAISGFFAGRGDSWTVLIINAIGLAANAVLAYWWIFGGLGLSPMGIAGAGWATVAGSTVSALAAWLLFTQAKYREEFNTLSGWRFRGGQFGRLMWFGLPNGVQWFIDGLAFTAFLILVGRLGKAETAATSIAFTINLLALLPVMGLGQAVEILVGRRLGEDKPDLAAQSTWSGFKLAWLYMAGVAILYATIPGVFLSWFAGDAEPQQWAAVAAMVPILLRFVAFYSLFDSANMIFSYALRGAGDTKFVTLVSIALAWPLMVFPTYIAWVQGWSLYWPWTFATLYVMGMAGLFLWRFLQGKWRQMRVIEPAVIDPEPQLLTPVQAVSGETNESNSPIQRAAV